MTDPGDFNGKIVAEFRANGGKVGGRPVNPAWYHNLLANPETAIPVVVLDPVN